MVKLFKNIFNVLSLHKFYKKYLTLISELKLDPSNHLAIMF